MSKVKITIMEVYEVEVPEGVENKVIEAQKLLDRMKHFKERRVIFGSVSEIKKAADSLEMKEKKK